MSQHPYATIGELSLADRQPGVIRIPSEQDVPFTDRVRALVDTAEFQRLRNVTQLALASRVYPGATHTRFEHALGVYHNALQYLWQLGRDPRFSAVVSPREAEILIVAALLHDIGHWPFCHPIEDMELPGMPPHEAFAREFLSPGTELHGVLADVWNIDAEEVLDILVARTDSPSYRLRRSILSGPIDIDKMDYLSRDSRHCGVPYGKNFDRHRLINSLIVNESADGLAITAKGKTAAEMMVFARYVMFTEVYWHHAVRSATTMFARTFYEVHPQLDLAGLFRMTEPELIAVLIQAARGEDVEQLSGGLFGRRRSLHKRLAEYSPLYGEDIYQAMRQLTYPELVRCSDRLTELLAEEFGIVLRRMDILVDAPPRHREVEFRVEMFVPAQQCYRPLRQVSPIVDAMARTQFDDNVKKVRIFAAPEVRERLRKQADFGVRIDAAVRQLLAESGVQRQ
ncbi:MAG: HD domain-containing protein [Planctomycetaceae bacterium]|nr:HD domain-containing protein [Planctomycetaceae bacterium]